MDQSKINVRYAKAFFSLAEDKNLTKELRSDTNLVADALNSSEDLIQMLDNPVVKTSEKINAITEIFRDRINEYSLNFIRLIIENKREKYMSGIMRDLENLFRIKEGIKKAVITSSIELSTTLLSRIKNILESKLKSDVELSTKVDPEIIGGFILVVDDILYDSSITTQFKKIRNQLYLS